MENKYNKYFWEFEQQYKDKAELINITLKEQFNSKVSDKIFGNDYLESVVLNYNLYDRKFKEWVKSEVLPYFNEETLISCYLIKLTDALMIYDIDKISSIMVSFKEIGLIKDIKLKENKIILVTKNNEVVKCKSLFNDKDSIQQIQLS